jgi:MYXO-CTERM domain-containing protein
VSIANVKRLLSPALLLFLWAPAARAQVGTGWVEYHPSSVIHMELHDVGHSSPGTSTMLNNGGASFDVVNGVEIFQLLNATSNRVERRMQNDYTSGRWQFEGEVRVSPPTNDESVMQVWGGASATATTQMIRAFAENNGTLKKYTQEVLISNIYGTWVRVNVIHDVAANKVWTYINGAYKTVIDGQAPSSWYHKYGCYGTLRTGTAKVEWRNVRHFKDGMRPADGAAPIDAGPPGGGAPDDASVGTPGSDAGTDDVATGNAGGTAGAAGAGGMAGASGSGGTVGGGPAGGTGGTSVTGPSTGGAGGSDTGGTTGEGGSAGSAPQAGSSGTSRSAKAGGCGLVDGAGDATSAALALLALGLLSLRRRQLTTPRWAAGELPPSA